MPIRFRPSLFLALSIAPLLWGLRPTVCAARDHADGFDGDSPTWTARYDKSLVHALAQRRTRHLAHSGTAAENIAVEIVADQASLKLEHKLPPCRLIDELQLVLWFRANRDGARLAVRVVLPYQTNPRTGRSLTVTLEGDPYKTPGSWQRLECRDLKARLERKRPQIQNQIFEAASDRHTLDFRGAYVDRAVVVVQGGRGMIEFFLDDLKIGPVIDPAKDGLVVQTGQEDAPREVEFRLDRLFFQGRPYFPRIIPYHGEQPGDLARMHLNLAHIPDYQDAALLEELRANGMRAIAAPPRARSPEGDPLSESEASLAPFGASAAPILFWYLGTRIAPEAKSRLAAWAEQVRNADRKMHRPLMADVTGLERSYSRLLSMLGIGRHALHSTLDMKTWRDMLVERRNQAQPGSFLFTWIQTEPLLATAEARRAAGFTPLVIEPEQIRLEVYAALAAGCRGLGFWTQAPLDDSQPGARERRLAITQLAMELELLEPWLATGAVQTQTRFDVQIVRPKNLNQLNIPFGVGPRAGQARDAVLHERDSFLRRLDNLYYELEAASISTEYGQLLLPVWYEDGAQYCPGQMAANTAEIVVPGANQSASVWLASTTDLRTLKHEPSPGGIKVTIPKFDMTAAIIISADRALIEKLRLKMQTLQEPSARVSLELAQAKLERVAGVDRRLHALGVGQVDALQIQQTARSTIDRAQTALARREYHEARRLSNEALEGLRILQRAYWNDAVRNLYAPVSSPHAICFQTLPDHWELVSRFGRSTLDRQANLLPAGDFEDFDSLVEDGWNQDPAEIDGIRAAAEVYLRPHHGHYCLRLVAVPDAGKETPNFVAERPVTVVSAPVPVRKGQIIYIGGWVNVAAPAVGNLDGALFYDSLGGPAQAFRWRKPTKEWEHFEALRFVSEDGELTLTMALASLGDVRFDDLQIIPCELSALQETLPGLAAPPAAGLWSKPLNLIKRVPGLAPPRQQPAPRAESPADTAVSRP